MASWPSSTGSRRWPEGPAAKRPAPPSAPSYARAPGALAPGRGSEATPPPPPVPELHTTIGGPSSGNSVTQPLVISQDGPLHELLELTPSIVSFCLPWQAPSESQTPSCWSSWLAFGWEAFSVEFWLKLYTSFELPDCSE